MPVLTEKIVYRWLWHGTAHLHKEFIPDPSTRLRWLRRTPDGDAFVMLPNGSTYKLRNSHLADCEPGQQLLDEEEWSE